MIDYLLVANRILKSKLGSDGRLIKYTDFERAILAKKQNKVRIRLHQHLTNEKESQLVGEDSYLFYLYFVLVFSSVCIILREI